MYSMTSPDGPEYWEGDQVAFKHGPFEDVTGRIMGYDGENEVYIVELDFIGELVITEASMIYIPALRADTPARVVVVNGPRAGEVGLASQVRNVWDGTAYFAVVEVELESGEEIEISSTSLVRSDYQGEELEEVPHV